MFWKQVNQIWQKVLEQGLQNIFQYDKQVLLHRQSSDCTSSFCSFRQCTEINFLLLIIILEKKLSLNLIEEVAGSHQVEYMPENYRGNKYFLMNLYTKVRKNGSVTTIWLCKCPKKGGDKSLSHPLLNSTLDKYVHIIYPKLPLYIINKPWISRKNHDKDINFIMKNNRR